MRVPLRDMTPRDSVSKYEQSRKHIAYESPCEKAERIAVTMRTKKRAQLRETARSKVRELRQGSASEHHPLHEESKAPHDTSHAYANTLQTSSEVNALLSNTLNVSNAQTSDIHHSMHTPSPQRDPSLANHVTSDEEVKGNPVTLTHTDTTYKAMTSSRDLDYDDASRDYLITRGHMMSGGKKSHTPMIN